MKYRMNKILVAFILLSLTTVSYGAQQILNNGETGLQIRTKINANDTELYARPVVTVANAVEYLYIKGSVSVDGSLRISVDATTDSMRLEKRVSGTWERSNVELRTTDYDEALVKSAYKAGRISYDPVCKVHIADTGYTDVRNDIGRETHTEVFNNTASQINNGDPVSVNFTFTGELPNVVPSTSASILSVLGFAGVATMDIPAGQSGIVTPFGLVHDVNTQSLVQGFLYIDDNGWYTQTRPTYPLERLIVGGVVKTGTTDGTISVSSRHIPRRSASRSYSFSSNGVGAGTHYVAGFYEWASSDVTLDEGSLTVTHGAAGLTKAAHVGIVPEVAGTVDTGQVGLQVTGTLDSESGPQVASQTAIITDDITTLTADVMAECLEKFSGQVTIALYTVSGSPTAYSLTFNYGFSKYEDFANIDGTVTAFNAKWLAGANDSAFDISLKYHNPDNWTYAATGFEPGNGDIANRLTDQGINSSLSTGLDGAYKRTNLKQFIDGSGLEGVIVEIVTNAPNTIINMNLHITAFSEELF